MQIEKYQICQRIDDQKRTMGLPLDELIPLLTFVFIGFLLSIFLTGIGLGVLSWLAIRHLKKGQGSGWLLNLCYWYLPLQHLKGVFMMKTPSSSNRFWRQ